MGRVNSRPVDLEKRHLIRFGGRRGAGDGEPAAIQLGPYLIETELPCRPGKAAHQQIGIDALTGKPMMEPRVVQLTRPGLPDQAQHMARTIREMRV